MSKISNKRQSTAMYDLNIYISKQQVNIHISSLTVNIYIY